ncbi:MULTISPECIES: hypothetical protein [unclassified Bartonella]
MACEERSGEKIGVWGEESVKGGSLAEEVGALTREESVGVEWK